MINQTWTSEKGTTTIPRRISAKARDAEKTRQCVHLYNSMKASILIKLNMNTKSALSSLNQSWQEDMETSN